jgi:DNA-binding response OmpR family regulator
MVIDISLPNINGHEFLRLSERTGIPMLVVSSSVTEMDKVNLKTRYSVDVLKEPVQYTTLKTEMHKIYPLNGVAHGNNHDR